MHIFTMVGPVWEFISVAVLLIVWAFGVGFHAGRNKP
jgi:hypothetical protein